MAEINQENIADLKNSVNAVYTEPQLAKIAEMAQLMNEACLELFQGGTVTSVFRETNERKALFFYNENHVGPTTSWATLHCRDRALAVTSENAAVEVMWSNMLTKNEVSSEEASLHYIINIVCGDKAVITHNEKLSSAPVPMTMEDKALFVSNLKSTLLTADGTKIPENEEQNYEPFDDSRNRLQPKKTLG